MCSRVSRQQRAEQSPPPVLPAPPVYHATTGMIFAAAAPDAAADGLARFGDPDEQQGEAAALRLAQRNALVLRRQLRHDAALTEADSGGARQPDARLPFRMNRRTPQPHACRGFFGDISRCRPADERPTRVAGVAAPRLAVAAEVRPSAVTSVFPPRLIAARDGGCVAVADRQRGHSARAAECAPRTQQPPMSPARGRERASPQADAECAPRVTVSPAFLQS